MRPLGFKLLALAIAQILSVNLHAAQAPTGHLSASTSPSTLVLKSASSLTVLPVSNGNQSSASSAMSSNTSNAVTSAGSGSLEQATGEQLALKFDTLLKKAHAAVYDSTPVASFSFVTADSLTTLLGNNVATGRSQSTANYPPVSASADVATGMATENFDDMLQAPGRVSPPESSNLDTATDLTVDDLMGFLDAFAANEFAAATLRSSIAFGQSNVASDVEAMLFLRPDAVDGAVVPEPGTLALFASTSLALYLARRRQRLTQV